MGTVAAPSLMGFLAEHQPVFSVWKGGLTSLTANPLGGNNFSLNGICPHCAEKVCFTAVTPHHIEQMRDGIVLWAVMQCQGCSSYICGCAKKSSRDSPDAKYLTHYPIGKPSNTVAAEIPPHIAADFMEALRCRYVDAYNATVEMCRRAVQASCLHMKAPKDKKLEVQIDWLAENGTITKPLQEMAHRIRLGGNAGAHPPKNGPEDEAAILIDQEYADAVIEFTEDFFHHVHVTPVRLNKYTFKKPPKT